MRFRTAEFFLDGFGIVRRRALFIALLGILFLLFPLPVFANTPPRVIDATVSPFVAEPGQEIIFQLRCEDKDGDPLEYVHFCIPSGCHEMERVGGSRKEGWRYRYVYTVSEGEYGFEYYFEICDGKDVTHFPPYYEDGGGGANFIDILSEKHDRNRIYLFSRDSNEPLWSYETGSDWVQQVAISDDGTLIAAKTSDYIYLFSRESAAPLWSFQCVTKLGKNEDHFAGWVDISSDGRYIAAGCQHKFYLFSKKSAKPLQSFSGYIYTTSISSDGRYIAVGTLGGESGEGDQVLLFSKSSNSPLWRYQADGNVHGLAISADGNYIAAGAHCPDRRAFLFSRQSNKPLVSFVSSQDSPVWAAAISSDGRYAVYGLDGGGDFPNVFIISPNETEPIQKFITSGYWVRSVGITADGRYAVAGGGDGNVYLFSPDSGQPLWRYKTQEKVGTVGISSDGKYVAAGSQDHRVYLLSRSSGDLLWNYQVSSGWVNTVDISSDGQYIVAGTGPQQYLGEVLTFAGGVGQHIEGDRDGTGVDLVLLLLGVTVVGIGVVFLLKGGRRGVVYAVIAAGVILIGVWGYRWYSLRVREGWADRSGIWGQLNHRRA